MKKITIVGFVPPTVEEKIASVEQARQDAIQAEKDFRRDGLTKLAHDAALFVVACNERLLALKDEQFVDDVIAATQAGRGW